MAARVRACACAFGPVVRPICQNMPIGQRHSARTRPATVCVCESGPCGPVVSVQPFNLQEQARPLHVCGPTVGAQPFNLQKIGPGPGPGPSELASWVELLVYRYLSNASSFVLCVVFCRVKDRHDLLHCIIRHF